MPREQCQGDDQITTEERMVNRRHPLSPWDPAHDIMKLAGKILLSMARILLTEHWPITAGLLRLLIGLALFYVDVATFHLEWLKGKVQGGPFTTGCT